jgi:hypothetical protein
MKRLHFYLFAVIAGSVLLFSSCEKEEVIKEVEKEVIVEKETEVQRISFESVELNDDGFQNNFPDGLILSDVDFYNRFDEAWSSWEGFSVSKNTDRQTSGYDNEYSVYAASGANGSEKFAIAFQAFNDITNCRFIGNQEFNFKSLMINNSTLTVLALKDGLFSAKAFGENDWFKIIITGLDANKIQTGKVEFYLADFRDGKSYICREWTEVDLTGLGKANKLQFTFESTDNGEFGMNTPAYACIDDIIYYVK